jgi:hypothetical protein
VKRHEEFVKNMSLLKKNWGVHDAVGLGIISLENAVQPVKSLHNPTGKNISLKIHYMMSVISSLFFPKSNSEDCNYDFCKRLFGLFISNKSLKVLFVAARLRPFLLY